VIKTQAHRTIFAISLTLVITLGFVVFTMTPRLPERSAQIENGLIDLTDFDFNVVVVKLPLNWDYYPGELLTPADFAARRAADSRVFTMEDEQAYQTGTYRAILKVKPGAPYAIYAWSLDYATRIFINGSEVLNVGTVADAASDFVPRVNNYIIQILPQSETVEVIIQYANFAHREGGAMRNIVFGLSDTIIWHALYTQHTASILGGALLLVALFYLMLFISGRGFSNLAFALTCFFYAIRNHQVLGSLFPRDYDWNLIYRLVYIDNILAVIALLLLVYSMYPTLLPKRVIRVTLIICAALTAVLSIAVFLIHSIDVARLFTPAYIVIAPAIVYVCVICGKLFKNGRGIDRITATGIAVLLAAQFLDIAFQRSIPEITRNGLGSFGMLTFVTCQMLALSAEKDMLDRLNRMKTEFLQNVGHEMKTPLAVINGYLELSLYSEKQKSEPDENIITNMTRALTEGNRAAFITKQIFDASVNEDGRMTLTFERINIKKLIIDVRDDYFAMLNKNHNTLTLDIPERLPDVYADAEHTLRVLVNLIHNAVRFTRHGVIAVSAETTGDCVKITVSDTGCGIPPELIPRIFDRFETGGRGTGTGLGLYICKQTVENHGGIIDIKSETDKGTEIYFTLPVWKGGKDE